MRRLIAAGILFIFVIVSYVTGFLFIRDTCNTAKEMLESCVSDYKGGKDAKPKAEELEKYWTKKETTLSAFADHDEIDEIELAISTLKVYSSTDKGELFDEYSETVETLLHQLKEDIIPSLHSIF